MSDITARVRNYTNQQGEQKGEYVKIGVIGTSNNGEYVLLDPSVNIAGVLIKQNKMNAEQGKPVSDSVMCSVLDNNQNNGGQSNNAQANQQQAPQQQQQQQQNYQQQNNRGSV